MIWHHNFVTDFSSTHYNSVAEEQLLLLLVTSTAILCMALLFPQHDMHPCIVAKKLASHNPTSNFLAVFLVTTFQQNLYLES